VSEQPAAQRRPPPGLLTASLVLWATATDRWAIAGFLAVALESARWLPVRVAVSDVAFTRLALVTRLAFLGLLVWLATKLPVPVALLTALGWLPVVLALVALPQAYSVNGLAPINVLRMFRAADRDRIGIDLGYTMVGVTLLAAAGSTRELPFFYPVLCALAAWGLHAVRAVPRGGRRGMRGLASWGGLFLVAATMGHFFHTGLSALQGRIEERAIAIMDRWIQMRPPLDRARTRIGDVGRVKLADTIVLRVKPDGALQPPFLLLDGSFSRYDGGAWTNRGVRHDRLPAEDGDAGIHVLRPGAASAASAASVGGATITVRGTRTIAPMPVPLEADRVQIEGHYLLNWNTRGALYAENPPPVLRYRATTPRGPAIDAPPGADDLEVPPRFEVAVDTALRDAGATGLSPEQALRAIRRFFREEYRYTTWLGDSTSGGRSLNAFLTSERSGHCEYFAAATTMLLRRAGIPARYATGYSVEEWSELEQQYVVRSRHGHAWTLAWMGGRWIEVDTTPSEWLSLDESSHRSVLEPLADLWAWLVLRFEEARIAGIRLPAFVLPGAAVLALLVVLWKLRGGLGRVAVRFVRRREPPVRREPSPLDPIERHFVRSGHPRPTSQSLMRWSDGLVASGRIDASEAAALRRLVADWYAARFGPARGTVSSAEIGHAARAWLAAHRRRAASRGRA
jgi:transglutaminase-like putative cysteine protease